jgi:prophage regulatory protein
MDEQILRLPQVVVKTGMSRSWIYQAIAHGNFPVPVALGARAVGWERSSVDAWIASRKPKGNKHAQ